MENISQLVGQAMCLADDGINIIVRMTEYPIIDVTLFYIVVKAPLARLSLNLGHCILKDGTW